jgi:hypothetical protein
MFLFIAAILIVLWVLGFLGHIAGNLIYALLVLALLSIIYHFVSGHGHGSIE